MVTNYAKRRVKLRIERAKFQFVLIVFCNRAVLLFNVLKKKAMDSDESCHSESEFYYPNEEDKENSTKLHNELSEERSSFSLKILKWLLLHFAKFVDF